MIKQKKAFTFMELIMVVAILAILSTIGISKYMDSLPDSRDAQRISDISNTKVALKLQKQNKGIYPNPGIDTDYFLIQNGATEVAKQGFINKNVLLSTLDNIPLDPKNNLHFFYSITKNKAEFEIATTLENSGNQKALTQGDYKSVSKNILPTILLATGSTDFNTVTSVDITDSENRKLFIFNGGTNNMPYFIDEGVEAYTNGTDLDDLFNEASVEFWQNSSFRTCLEIKEAGKSIGNGEYQVLSSTGSLTNTGCTSM